MTYQELKTQFVSILTQLGYDVADNGVYRDTFPWLQAGISSIQNISNSHVKQKNVTIRVDVFSTYTGEKEILDILENIETAGHAAWVDTPAIENWYLSRCQIMDDKETGPCRKHGTFWFNFTLLEGIE